MHSGFLGSPCNPSPVSFVICVSQRRRLGPEQQPSELINWCWFDFVSDSTYLLQLGHYIGVRSVRTPGRLLG